MDQIKDSERYSALLFLSANNRPFAAAIYAFDDEINRIAQLASEPMPGEIRLQWWREVVSGERAGEGHANPVARALLETIQKHQLPIAGFLRFLDAKVVDLYNDPMPDVASLEAYLGESESFIFQMIALVCGVETSVALADACGHSGVAYGIAKLLRLMPYHTRHGQVYVPGNILDAAGLDAGSWLAQKNTGAALVGMISFGREHLQKARAAIKILPKEAHSAFLSLALVEPVLNTASQQTKGLKSAVEISPLKKQWVLWKAAVFGI